MSHMFLASALLLAAFLGNGNRLEQTLQEAIDSRTVYTTFTGNEGSTHYLKPLQGEIRNLTNKSIYIKVPAGYHFKSTDEDVQDIVITQEELIALAPKETKQVPLSGMCIQHNNIAPNPDDGFKLAGMAQPDVQRLASYLDEKNIQNCQGQQAMWIVADKSNIGPLLYDNLDSDRELIDLTCEIIGRPKLTDKQLKELVTKGWGRTQTKAELFGKFAFNFNRKVPIHIALFTDQGIVLKEIYKEEAKPGRHQVEYTFDALPYQGQTIHAKLIAFDDVLLDRVIEL